jgi:UDP-N-acetylmuramoylalanine--D-glutamate ligase
MKETDIAVLELSSFQLLTMDTSPEIAVVTNLAPNHLDVHKGMEEYVAAKKNIFTHQTPGQKLVLNRDNDIAYSFRQEAPGQVTLFSRQNPLDEGVAIENGVICVKKNGTTRPVLPVADILLPGVHNVENFEAAIAAVDGLVPDEVIRTFAKEFGGVEHRIELVRVKDGVRYYNDSIASSPSRTMAGLRSFDQKVILIAGGYDKHLDYDVLGPDLVAHVKRMVLTGATSAKLRSAAEGAEGYSAEAMPITEIDDFGEAVRYAASVAEPGDVVILSPASASFDKFKNFMVRGNTFKELVRSL